ncbi:MAG: two-component regulator propeller domain-containing protein [Microbacter sp.]
MKHFVNIIVFVFLMLFFGIQQTHGQISRFYTSTNSGLLNSQINQIYQDRIGFVWIATEDGLSCFDGMKFTSFMHQANDTTSLLSNYVQSLYEDSSHHFWIGTASGLQYYDRYQNRFCNFLISGDDKVLLKPFISSIVPFDSSHVLVGTSGYGFYIINALTMRYISSHTNRLYPANSFVQTLLKDSEGNLWVGTENDGIFLFRRDNKLSIDNENAFVFVGHYLEGQQITSVIDDAPDQKVFIGSMNKGIFVFDKKSGLLRPSKSPAAQKCSVKSMFHDSRGRFWIGTNDQGLVLFNANEETIYLSDTVNQNPTNRFWHVYSIMEDTQGNIWAALYEKGIYLIPNFTNKFDYKAFSSVASGQNTSCVMAILVDRQGGLWVGTDGSGLFYQAKGTSSSINFTKTNSGLTSNSVTSLWEDDQGSIWVGTTLDGLFTMDASHRRIVPFIGKKALSSQKITCIQGDSSGKIWVGTYGGGINYIDKQTGQIVYFKNIQGTPSIISNNWINTLLFDHEGHLIVGTFKGLNSIDLKTGAVTYYNHVKGLPDNTKIYALCEDHRGMLWIGTNSGLIAFDRKDGKTRLYTMADGLPNNVINAIREDSDHNLWISTNHGLAKFSLETGRIVSFYVYDGLQSDEFRRGAVFVAADGKLYFGGINGINSFNPKDINHSRRVPDVYITDFLVFNKSVNVGRPNQFGVKLDSAIEFADKITLSHSDNVFSIQFDALEYTHPQSITYQYKMEGFDKDWKITDAYNRTVTYTNLSAGKYIFKVKAANADMEGSESMKSLTIIVLPPWWLTWWAKLIYMLLIVAVGFYFYRRVKQQFRAKQWQLQQRHEEEIKEAKLQFFTNISHEIRTPITLIISPLKQLQSMETDAKRKALYQLMYRNALRILRLINQLMDMRKIDNKQMKLHFQETDLVFLIKDVMMSFDFLAKNKKIDFQFQSKMQALNVWIDPFNFDKILFNILSNAFKFTPENGSITLSLSVGQDESNATPLANYVEIGISDSGPGIDPLKIDQIFDRFVQGSGKNEHLGSGVGLHLTKQLVELHHGTVFVVNNEVGCTFFIRIPLSSAHLTKEELEPSLQHQGIYSSEPDIEVTNHELGADSASSRGAVKSLPKVVVVDDDKDMLSYLRFELGTLFRISTFEHSKEAWNAIASEIPDVVISDIVMPEMDGNELCSKIKTNPNTNHIPVILLSSMTKDEDIISGLDCGADVYLTKPFNIDILKRHIHQVIASRETIRKKFTLPLDVDYNLLKVNSADKRLLEKTIKTIYAHMEDPDFSVEKLSIEVGLSRVHLNRKMKELIQISPSDMIRSIRLKQAAYLMINNEINISEVAYKVGFASHSYFSNSFHDFFGMKPSEFIDKYKDDPDNPTLKEILGSNKL